MVIFIILWLLFGYIAWAMALGKKLHVVAWLLISVLLGPFAIVLVMRQAPAPYEPWSAGKGGHRNNNVSGNGGGSAGCAAGCGGGGCGGGGGG